MTASSVATPIGALIQLTESLPRSNVYYTTSLKDTSHELSTHKEAIQLLENNDPFSEVIEELPRDLLTSVFTDSLTLLKSLPHLGSLKGFPVLVNVNIDLQDYSSIPSFKDLSIPILISSDLEAFTENSKRSIEIISTTLNPVLHFINYDNIPNSVSAPINVSVTEFNEEAVELTQDQFTSFKLVNGSALPTVLIANLSSYGEKFAQSLPSDASLLEINAYRPWNNQKFLELLPASIKKIVVVQGSNQKPEKNGFEPVLLDFFNDFNSLIERNIDQILVTSVGHLDDIEKSLVEIVSNVKKQTPDLSLYVGRSASDTVAVGKLKKSVENVLNLEKSYFKVLQQLFASHLSVWNEYSSPNVQSNNPEFGYGSFLSEEKKLDELLEFAKRSLDVSLYTFDDAAKLVQLISKWISYHDKNLDEFSFQEANEVGSQIFKILQDNQDSKTVLDFLKLAPTEDSFSFKSNWLIGSDAWSYDLGNSGVHQVLFSKKNINVLLIDSEPYQKEKVSKRRKKDVGLYAMNSGEVYVASVAVYASYTQLLTAFIEASKFNGPSIVLAYLPYHSETDTPLEVLKETKNAVESGYWPLYRYDPNQANNEDVFKLDSSVLKKELQSFLDRENKLTLLSRSSPELARNLKQSASDRINSKQERKAKIAYDQLLEGLAGPPLNIYFASDGGNAASVAKRLGARAAARGLKSVVLSMDEINLEDLPGEENVVFITSTAGQGEFPQDGKSFWDSIKSNIDLDLASLNFAVFGLGDSLYWPRKEDKHFYNRPATLLFNRLELLTAKPLVPLGLGDDQDADGFQTGYGPWEAELWSVLGVSNADVPDEPKAVTNEDMKLASDYLRGTIVEGLADESTGAIHAYDQQLTKFHGIYMQDDRDIRETRKSQGIEPYYIFMARVRLPGGTATPEQWLVLDKLADETGNGTLKITTRATFQLHGVVKRNLKHTIRAMNSTLMDTLAACGDVNRNVMISALPGNAKVHAQVAAVGTQISEYFLPKTTAYHEIWLSGNDDRDYDPNWPSVFENRKEGPTKKKTLVSGNALVDVEPLYSKIYLPRKFKVNITVPPFNDVDVWSSDVGLIAIIDEATQTLTGFNMYVGGGMGTTHNNKKTYPRTGSCFGFVTPEDVIAAIEGVMIVQRDNGDRTNRKHARLKYTIDDIGVEAYKEKVEEIAGKKFEPARAFQIDSNQDFFGWIKDETGLNHFTVFVENGRVEDTVDLPQKAGFKKISKIMQKNKSGHFRLTGNQHCVISGIKDEHIDEIKDVMRMHKLDNTDFSGLRLSSASCVGLPTCGLAMAESERYLPQLITKLENILEEYGLRHDSVVMRMTGCPNGCARPWLAEVALIGKAPETYNMMLGGGFHGQRLNKLYRASIKEDEVIFILKNLFKRWSLERNEGEHFGDFVIRIGEIKPTTEGKFFHDDIPDEAF